MKRQTDIYTSTQAEISACGQYRYFLERAWASDSDRMLVVGLNPSTADATIDDATIRRCVGFAKAMGFSGLHMANLFALRSTDPKALQEHPDPSGPHNDEWLAKLHTQATVVVAAWGNWGKLYGRSSAIRRQYPGLQCFGVTASGEPKHPLYLPSTTKLCPLPLQPE